MSKVTAPNLIKMKQEGRKISVLTAYSYSMARLLDEAGIPISDDPLNDDAIFTARQRLSVGFSDWRPMYGTSGG